MKVTRLYATRDGHSHFQDVEILLADSGEIGKLSERIGAQAVILRETPGDYDYDFHTAPERQFIIMLSSVMAVRTSLGETREFRAGDILFVEDTTGRGHKSWSVDHTVRRSVFVPIGDARLPYAEGSGPQPS